MSKQIKLDPLLAKDVQVEPNGSAIFLNSETGAICIKKNDSTIIPIGGSPSLVEAYESFDDFPEEGEVGILYIDEEESDLYLWTGSEYESQSTGGISEVAWGDITGTLSSQTDLNNILVSLQDQLDDVDSEIISYLDVSAFPVTGEQGTIYIDLENSDLYLWTGSVYELQGGGEAIVENQFFSQYPLFPESLNYYIIEMDHFPSAPSPLTAFSNGADAYAVPRPFDVPGAGTNNTTKAIGLFGVSAGTATGYAGITRELSQGNFGTTFFGSHAHRFGVRMNLAGIPTTGDVEITSVGFCSHINTESTDGVYFRHDPDTNSGKWQAIAISSDLASSTTVDTGVSPVSTVYQILEIVVNRAGTEAKFYINGSLVATITTNIPPSVPPMLDCGVHRRKTSGSTSRACIIDTIYIAHEKLSSR